MTAQPIDTTKPIMTLYEGVYFRSRLEARWARFFDSLEEPWLYESEGFDIPRMGYYLPDFYLPRSKTWLEIKPVAPSTTEQRKCLGVCEARAERVVLVSGSIGFWLDPLQSVWHRDSALAWLPSKDPDGHAVAMEQSRYLPCRCPGCDAFSFEYEGDGGIICAGRGLPCKGGEQREKSYTFGDERIRLAVRLANAESFWG